MKKIRNLENGLLNPKVLTCDPNVLKYQVPGGMLSNLINQLKQQNALDKLEEVLKEVGCKYTLIGDQAKPSSLREAISTAFEATKEI